MPCWRTVERWSWRARRSQALEIRSSSPSPATRLSRRTRNSWTASVQHGRKPSTMRRRIPTWCGPRSPTSLAWTPSLPPTSPSKASRPS
ncbi:hypothetical protein ACFFX0_03350 [Citricoccus parietis]|uniref:Uncharacterized protein n=1 Tax=Citricoccus parietis TaxID=592307 RepID=A0ABV5FVH2_9MICC